MHLTIDGTETPEQYVALAALLTTLAGKVAAAPAPASEATTAATVAPPATVEADKPKRTRAAKADKADKPEPVIADAPPPPPAAAAVEAEPSAAAPTPPPPPPPPPPPADAGEAKLTKADCIAALEKLLEAKGMDACGSVLGEFKDADGKPCAAVRWVAESDYPAFIARCAAVAK